MTTSPTHAPIVERDGHAVIPDDHSRTGVFVGGRRVAEAVLHDGDELRVGTRRMRFYEVVAA